MKNSKKILIIGGGYGGLFAGALLAKEGCQVTVLEKNTIPGGGLQCFHRNGTVFETGMHIVGGFQDGATLHRLCSYLEIANKLKIRPTDKDSAYTVVIGSDKKIYNFPRGRKAFTTYLQKLFPHESKGIADYVDGMYSLISELTLLQLSDGDHSLLDKSPSFLIPASEFISNYICDEKLQHLLAHFSPLYSGIKGHTPTYIHAAVTTLYIEGMAQFVGGSQQMADELIECIQEHEGKVMCGNAVDRINIEEGHVSSITTTNNHEYTADYYISAIHPATLKRLLPDNAFPKAYSRRIESIPNSSSCFCVFIRFKHQTQPYINRPIFFFRTKEDVWGNHDYDETIFPQTTLCFMPPTSIHCKWAERMVINCPMQFDVVRKWADTTVGHRGTDYENWKTRMTNKVLEKIEELFPGIHDRIESVTASSPLTIRDYFGTKDGAMFGYQHDSRNIFETQISPKTKIPNLFLTGQNISLHGICGVPLAAILTIEAIMGKGKITKNFNAQQ